MLTRMRLAQRLEYMENKGSLIWGEIISPDDAWLYKTFRCAVIDGNPEFLRTLWPPHDPNEWQPPLDQLVDSTFIRQLKEEQLHSELHYDEHTEPQVEREISMHFARRVETMAGCALVAFYLRAPGRFPVATLEGRPGTTIDDMLARLVEHWPGLRIGADVLTIEPALRVLILQETQKALAPVQTMTSWAQAFASVVRKYFNQADDNARLTDYLESIAVVRHLVDEFLAEDSALERFSQYPIA